MLTSEARYRSLFYGSPTSLRESDYSEVKKYFDQLREAGVTDFRQYFHSHPEAVRACGGEGQGSEGQPGGPGPAPGDFERGASCRPARDLHERNVRMFS